MCLNTYGKYSFKLLHVCEWSLKEKNKVGKNACTMKELDKPRSFMQIWSESGQK